MNIFDSGLHEVIDYILAKKNCFIEDVHAREMLKEILKKNLHEMGAQTNDGANSAGRRTGGFFDLERTFNLMNIPVEGLIDIWTKDQNRAHPIIGIRSAVIPDNDYHRGPPTLMSLPFQREKGHSMHLHEHLPDFPSIHTYQKTWLENHVDRNYVDIRIHRAKNQLNIQKSLNSYYLRTRTSYSLFLKPQSTNRYDVLVVEPSDLRKPAYMSALLSPRESCNQHPIDEDDEEVVLNSPFMAAPVKKSMFPRKPIPDEDFRNIPSPPPPTVILNRSIRARALSSEEDDEMSCDEEESSTQSE